MPQPVWCSNPLVKKFLLVFSLTLKSQLVDIALITAATEKDLAPSSF